MASDVVCCSVSLRVRPVMPLWDDEEDDVDDDDSLRFLQWRCSLRP